MQMSQSTSIPSYGCRLQVPCEVEVLVLAQFTPDGFKGRTGVVQHVATTLRDGRVARRKQGWISAQFQVIAPVVRPG